MSIGSMDVDIEIFLRISESSDLLVVPQVKAEDHQCIWDSSFGDHEFLSEIPWQSVQ